MPHRTPAGSTGRSHTQRGWWDYFFIVTAIGTLYLIPFDVVEGKQGIVLDRKYGSFAVT
jgi:hypothetical protein